MVRIEFNSAKDVKFFVKNLYDNLKSDESTYLKSELYGWINNAYTTSSEYLGEIREILQKALNSKPEVFNDIDNRNIQKLIREINKAFK